MLGFGHQDETSKLRDTVDELPARVDQWTDAQHATFTTQSDRAMRQQNGVSEPDELT